MRTTERKAREVAERDRALVSLALSMIRRDGFHNLTLGHLAEAGGYSKGTVYKHFTCREDLLIELAAENGRRQLRHFQAIGELPWDGIRALYGFALAYLRHAETFPILFECTIYARMNAVRQVASAERMERWNQTEFQISRIVQASVARTVEERSYGDPAVAPETAVDTLRSFILGYAAMQVLSEGFAWGQVPERETRFHAVTSMLQGLGWRRLPPADLGEIQDVIAAIVGEEEECGEAWERGEEPAAFSPISDTG